MEPGQAGQAGPSVPGRVGPEPKVTAVSVTSRHPNMADALVTAPQPTHNAVSYGSAQVNHSGQDV